ncbi:MAG: ATP-binding protein [Desulfobacteraceae bacterium]|nr:ATP-binding protein [Desulfobacteraceae bacterium]
MIKEICIENFKSVQSLKFSLGQINVLIGENGCGKSNILEAIAFASAAASNKLDNEFLVSRGIRVTDPKLMRSAFNKNCLNKEIKISIKEDGREVYNCLLQNNNEPYSKWVNNHTSLSMDIQSIINFLIYSPENLCLRTFEKEGQIQPLGINGEGLFKLLKVLQQQDNKQKFLEINKKLKLMGWFRDLEIPHGLSVERSVKIKDKYIEELVDFDQKSANEGFLFLLFYFALFVSSDTPEFFAIDNIDASLNPKLCSQLVKELVTLSKKYKKQSVFTAHNPAVLDGLNLDDDEQRLFVVYRNKLGNTKVRQIFKPKTIEGQEPVRLSEAFLRGYIGGLPKNF